MLVALNMETTVNFIATRTHTLRKIARGTIIRVTHAT
jgi:hypothetical protein